MSTRQLLPIALATLIVAAVFIAWEGQDDIVREENGNFVLHSQSDRPNDKAIGQLKVGGGWCLHAPKQTMAAQLTIDKCATNDNNDKKGASMRWLVHHKTGLVQLHQWNLCLHADYVSEPEGALTSLQSCNAKSERQKFRLDQKSHVLRLKRAPKLCVHSVDADRQAGQPVLIMPCKDTFVATGEQGSAVAAEDASTDDASDASEEEEADQADQADVDHVLRSASVDVDVQKEQAKAVQVPKFPKYTTKVSKEQKTQQAKSTATALSAALERIDGAMTLYHTQTKAIQVKLAKYEAHAPKNVKKIAAVHKQLKEVNMEHTGTLRATIMALQTHFDATAKAAHMQSSQRKKVAQDKATRLRRAAKKRAALAIAEARKALQKVVKASKATLEHSTEARQRTRTQLVKVRSKTNSDEVKVAEAALKLAKVNKRTHAANIKANRAVRLASTLASKQIQFAKIMLASRLKAISSTKHLSTDKADLTAQSMIATAQEALVTAKQRVLMSFHGTADKMNLDDIVGKDSMVALSSDATQTQRSATANSAVEEFDSNLEQSSYLGRGLRDQDLIDNHAASLTRAPEDEIYTQKMQTCSFPYSYNGKKYYRCKASKKGHWCATKVDSAYKIKQWDYCVLNKRAVVLAKQAAMEAAQIEIKRMLVATGAKITPAALRESLRAAAAAQQASVTKTSKKSGRTGGAQVAKQPSMNTAQAKAKVDAMINRDATKN